ncbi:MAG: WD40 repeat domain-containing protein, partial [Cyclobacteriaceae bacterium]
GLPQRGVVKLMDTEKKIILKTLTGHRAGVSSVEFSPDGDLVAGAGYDRRLLLWVVDHEEDLPIVMDNNNGNVWDIAFTHDSKNLIASCNEGEVRIWPTDSRMLAELVCPKLTRNMTRDEWYLYVSKDTKKIPYENTCQKLLIKPL